jgi:protein O-mannosyl-transferase
MTAVPEQPRLGSSARTLACVAAIAAVTLVTFGRLPVQAKFTNWDDSHTVVENVRLAPPTAKSLRWMWENPQADLYVPVTYTVWWALARASSTSGPDKSVTHDPHVFHAANVALHVLAAVMAFVVVRRLLRRVSDDSTRIDLAAGIGAMLFAVHPVQVECVAWVSGLKDVLAGLLALVAIDRYLVYATLPRERSSLRATAYVLAMLATAAAMLAKPSAVAVAPIVAMLDVFVLRRRAVDVLRGTIPLFLMTVPTILIGRHFQPAAALTTGVSPGLRPLVATDALAYYAWKLLAPLRLCVDYGRHPSFAVASGAVWWTWLVPAALGTLAWLVRRRAPLVAAGAGVFVVALLPVLGLVPFDFQEYSTVADHYLYLPMLGVALIAAQVVVASRPAFVVSAGIVIIAALAVLSFGQSGVWRDSGTLFAHQVDVNGESWLGHNNLAQALAADGRLDDAEPLVRRSIELRADNPQSLLILGQILMEKGQVDEAVRVTAHAVRLRPRDVVGQVNLAWAYGMAGRFDNAVRHYQAALTLDPENARALRMLPQAIAARDRALATRPTTAPATAVAASQPASTDRSR